MSLIIEGMKMPKFRDVHGDGRGTVYFLMLTVNKDGTAYLYANTDDNEFHQVKELPKPHGRLIDADAYQYSGDLIDEPTIIEAEHKSEAQKWARFGRDISKGLQEGIDFIKSEVPE